MTPKLCSSISVPSTSARKTRKEESLKISLGRETKAQGKPVTQFPLYASPVLPARLSTGKTQGLAQKWQFEPTSSASSIKQELSSPTETGTAFPLPPKSTLNNASVCMEQEPVDKPRKSLLRKGQKTPQNCPPHAPQ